MAARQDSGELYEVFKNLQEQRPAEPVRGATRQTRNLTQAAQQPAQGAQADEPVQRPVITIALDTAVVYGVLVALTVVLAFTAGLWWGQHRLPERGPDAGEIPKVDMDSVAPSGAAASDPGAAPLVQGLYTLVLESAPRTAQTLTQYRDDAAKYARFYKQEFHVIEAEGKGKSYYQLTVGRFSDPRSRDAQDAQGLFQRLMDRNTREQPFKDCFFREFDPRSVKHSSQP